MSKPDGGPAFPQSASARAGYHEGMTLRDFFAAAALQGLCAKCGVGDLPIQSANIGDHDERAAYQAYRYADAMLAERARSGREEGA